MRKKLSIISNSIGFLFILNRINNNYSHISIRIPVKLTNEQSKIANKKVKNVKYNKMSNKNSIKKTFQKFV